jgi:hypothetical protein
VKGERCREERGGEGEAAHQPESKVSEMKEMREMQIREGRGRRQLMT